jgi:hypothetical protein
VGIDPAHSDGARRCREFVENGQLLKLNVDDWDGVYNR